MVKLKDIKDVVQQFAEAGKAALGLDIEIIDEDRRFLAGTGRIKDILGKEIKRDGTISRIIFERNEDYLIVNDPGHDEMCIGCDRYGICQYRKAIYATIKYNGITIGVIGIGALSEAQENLILGHEREMLDFLDKIGKLIGTKVQEREILKQIDTYTKMMDTVFENINRGAVIVNKEFNIIKANQYILDRLCFDIESIQYKRLDDVFPGIIMDSNVGNLNKMQYEDLYYKNGNVKIDLLYASTPVFAQDELEFVLYFFEDYKVAKRFAISLTEKNDIITFKDIIGRDKVITDFIDKVKTVSMTNSTVMLIGETGTGKELFARSIHNESRRRTKPFVAINCGAMPETLIESELFGYEKGAFTGADKTGKHGKFYFADKGTLFLDEVENMPIYLQQKLLRVIERKEIDRIGSTSPISIDVRIIAATNVDLRELVERGEFREDLYHRLNVIPLKIPPLRDRGEDVLFISEYFIDKFSEKFNKKVLGLSDEVRDLFRKYRWKGNVRELQNTIEYAMNMVTEDYIDCSNLPAQFRENEDDNIKLKTLEEVEKEHIVKALDKYGWSEEGRIMAAKYLGTSRSTIYRKIKKYNLLD
ncbi:Transcriptional regulator containing PAS, AAA-type ATPase, and DNA-binding Fis domains [Dethiosulfatibacter aminovorans DSM 17477]|uniref:Transcriptional regulator containing PAS, AAA-type ATPase, and DNA-binding Fis domains n=1 Tax=Dethiosulfatibacter aminovorans DSM 17477 TaxID=1121476 RepID=A0A1M6K8Z4_9FIRM|nr:sigma 54-interacting transcriptional regulator [Dethiosulfatibacter aminovorans]SHJ55373.1 Transcriptional regulator containing PAS, AAA-type ATPase, and DNA-binding Fis domains [Dethiosulfatibacter aminovorans DSM 17477]